MNKNFLKSLILGLIILSAEAQALEFDKPLKASVRVTSQAASGPASSAKAANFRQNPVAKKTVTLMNIRLTSQQKQTLLHFHPQSLNIHSSAQLQGRLPSQGEVSMQGVPVLDQGQHGSCVTFANTAAIDALLNKGDYVSQLCHLSLGSYFEEKGYLPSGWEGSEGPLVLNQIIGFGIVSKDKQREKTCGGLKEYPGLTTETGSPMSLEDFKQVSENLNDNFLWLPALSFYERFQWDADSDEQGEALLRKLKKAISTHSPFMESRFTFGVLLPVDHCSAGACARYHFEEDTWALTKEIVQDQNVNFGGHEMIIVGYDDNAVATDHEGHRHQGLLTLRNSWGENAGDHGNYYMSYDFFKQFVLEVQELVFMK